MDIDQETARFKLWLIAILAFVVSLYVSFVELKYLVFGTTTAARITRVQDVTDYGRGGHEYPRTIIGYEFTDKDGLQRRGQDKVDRDSDDPRSGTIPVRYMSGEDGKMRIASYANYLGVIVFFGILIWMGVMVSRLVKEERRTRPKPTTRSGPYAKRR